MPSDDNGVQHLLNLNCPFEIKERSPCDPLYRLISTEEEEDGTITMILELVEEGDA